MKQEKNENNLMVIIDDREVIVYHGETILDAARREKIIIPTLCHDPRIKPFSSCFLCVVQVEGMKGLQPSCSTPVSQGMRITTTGSIIRQARRTALELLLSNHYADCLGPCKQTCPAGVDVQGYISLIDKGLFKEAIALIKQSNPLPAICGRVCVRPCELVCRRNLLEEGKGLGIDYLKRYAADIDLAASDPYTPVPEPETGRKVAVIGAGPAGLSAAYWLRLRGHTVHIFEAAPQPGGWLRYGIPEYRLPNSVLDREIETITTLGVVIKCNTRLGKEITFKEINSFYDAMILSPGSQVGTRLGCEGDEAEGVMPGIDFLRDMEITGVRPDLSGKKVIVVGGGNTAMDCCRTAVRCGAETVQVVYRRSEKEMPANPIEIEESRHEGVEYLFLTNPVSVIKGKDDRIRYLRVVKMQLGDPDDSGRRKPIPVKGSEFNIEADLVLAAIGQKTDLSFLDEINSVTTLGEFRRNKWGDIEADSATLQTGVKNIFAAGDGVTGPDTIIGAIAQAAKASLSCHQYIMGEEVIPKTDIFISRRENFRTPEKSDIPDRFVNKPRNEMPLLAPLNRGNFNEVELGYASERIVREESSRCLECGCIAYGSCDLQKYATEYGAVQKKYPGEFLTLAPEYDHPVISIDHNKCILCGRCVRICHELAGADALGFQERGFRTLVGPGPGLNLTDTFCSSCGLCISTCPTGAITERTSFKPIQGETDSFVTIDFIGSEGAALRLHHRQNFFTGAEGSAGMVNPDASIGKEARYSYRLLNYPRLTRPLLKENGSFKEISFEHAFRLIGERLKKADSSKNVICGGARLTNEELCLLARLAQSVSDPGKAYSFHYSSYDNKYDDAGNDNIRVNELDKAEYYYVFGTDLLNSHQLTGYRIFNNCFLGKSSICFISTNNNAAMERKAEKVITPSSYYYFVRSVISYLLHENLQNDIFVSELCTGFDQYRIEALKDDFRYLAGRSGVPEETITSFASEFVRNHRAAVIFAERDIDQATASELRNLCLLTGKVGREGSGILCLRKSCNSQGLIDAGFAGNEIINRLNDVTNLLIFGEDPAGLAIKNDKIGVLLKKAEFIVVQDFWMTETAALADLVLPSSFIFESGGSFTSSGKVINKMLKQFAGQASQSGLQQLMAVLNEAGVKQEFDAETISVQLHGNVTSSANERHAFKITAEDTAEPIFRHGCNSMEALFSSEILPLE